MNASIKNAASKTSDASKKAWAATTTAATSPAAKEALVMAGTAGLITLVVMGTLKAGEALGL